MLADSHCHLDRVDLNPYAGDFAAMIDAAAKAGVSQLLCVSIDLEHYPAMRRLIDPFPRIAVSVGVHPNETGGEEPTVDRLLELARDPRVVAIGETGLDYYRSKGELSWQHQRFRTHIEAARACAKPLIIHTREARDHTLDILTKAGAETIGGVMHCFSEDWETARRALDLGFYISFSGIVTFKSADALREVARKTPSDRLLIETDAPYLAPVPRRGKPNEPRLVTHVADCIAEVRGIDPIALAELTSANYRRLFALDT